MNLGNSEKVVPLKLDVKNTFVDFTSGSDGQKGFTLSNGIDLYTFYSETEEDLKKWYHTLTKWCVQKNINKFYEEGELIGKGAFGKVILVL
jgi:hypothetical protein